LPRDAPYTVDPNGWVLKAQPQKTETTATNER